MGNERLGKEHIDKRSIEMNKKVKVIALLLGLVLALLFLKILIVQKPSLTEGNYHSHNCWATKCDNPSCYRVRIDEVGLFRREAYYCEEHEAEAIDYFELQSGLHYAFENYNEGDGRTCKSCGRTFEDVGSGSDSRSIASSGMCNNCRNNFKGMTGN